MIELSEFKLSLIKNEINFNKDSFYLLIIEKMTDYDFCFIETRPKNLEFYVINDFQKYIDLVNQLNVLFYEKDICIYNLYYNNKVTSVIKFFKF